jgi:hypothetical protein
MLDQMNLSDLIVPAFQKQLFIDVTPEEQSIISGGQGTSTIAQTSASTFLTAQAKQKCTIYNENVDPPPPPNQWFVIFTVRCPIDVPF